MGMFTVRAGIITDFSLIRKMGHPCRGMPLKMIVNQARTRRPRKSVRCALILYIQLFIVTRKRHVPYELEPLKAIRYKLVD